MENLIAAGNNSFNVDIVIWDRTSFLGYFFSPLPDKVLAIKYDDETHFTISSSKGEFVDTKKLKKITHCDTVEVTRDELNLGNRFLFTVVNNRYMIRSQKEFLKAYIAIIRGKGTLQDKLNAFEQGLYFKGWQ